MVYGDQPYASKPPPGIWLMRMAFAVAGFDEGVARFYDQLAPHVAMRVPARKDGYCS